MANITMKGKPLHTNGEMPAVGAPAPDFQLTGTDMAPVTLQDSNGKVRVLSVVPSIDTGVCSIQTARFNREMDSMPEGVVGLTVSVDTPFAQKRWCGTEGVEKMQMLSDWKDHSFGRDYGLYIEDAGINARAVLVLDRDGKVAYTQLCPEISEEPDYNAVLAKAREIAG